MKTLILATVVISGVVFTTGCKNTMAANIDVDEYENAIIVELATAGGDVTPVTPISHKHKRADCPNDGWVGDGTVRTRCLDCDPPYTQEETKSVPFGEDEIPSVVLTEETEGMLKEVVAVGDVHNVSVRTSDSGSGAGSCTSGSCGPAAASGPVRRVVAAQPVRRVFSRIRSGNGPGRRFFGRFRRR